MNRFVAFNNPFRYRGYYYDFETKLYYLNSRYYDPEIGRFINADDISVLDLTNVTINGLNLYAYCLNNPVNEVDENGYFIWLLGLFAIGALIGATSYTASYFIKGITQNDWNWSWGEFFGSVFGTAFAAPLAILPGGLYLSAFAAGLFSNILTDGFNSVVYGVEFNLGKALIQGIKDGIIFAVFAGFMGKVFKVQGINMGKGSWGSVTKQVYTKFKKNLITSIKFKTFLKIYGVGLYESILDIIFEVSKKELTK